MDNSRWPDALSRLSGAFQGDLGVLTVGSIQPMTLITNLMTGTIVPPPNLEELIDRLSPTDLRLQYGMSHPGKAFACRQVLDEKAWTASPFYREILEPNGVPYSIVCMDVVDRHYVFSTGTLRGDRDGSFTNEEVRQFESLTPHLIRAVRTQIRLGQQQSVTDDLRATLNALVAAVILVDATGKVWFANHAAESILAQGDGLGVSQGRLRGGTPGDSGKIEAMVAETVMAARASRLPGGDALTLDRPSGKAPLNLLCVPMRADRLEVFPLRPSAMLFVSDPEAERPIPEALIARMYGLTPAEARLCGDLLRGMDLAGHAERHGITANTARTHLKSIFAKTGTGRQAELLRLILAGPMGQAVLDGLELHA
ncbi:helix-turn-helix transcriptional regulator [Paramagnetospirillum marisnigri]|uniref:helix-turn-helix transcriptional regulator n=1 Tax=Paramagnetospirillum marisnigri TaxID=1285242 RepID=UPI0012E8314F|nr:hypothetical protein [Paramagnetospirillum marisnigri]